MSMWKYCRVDTAMKKNDSKSSIDIEAQMNEDNKNDKVWKNQFKIENFIIVCTDRPNSLECVITMGFKNPTDEVKDKTNPDTISGQQLNVDIFTAKIIMAKPKQELYDLFMQKNNTEFIE